MFDIVDIFTKLISSNVANSIHCSFGEFYNLYRQDELYKSLL